MPVSLFEKNPQVVFSLYFFFLACANLVLIFDLIKPTRRGRIILAFAMLLVLSTPHVSFTAGMIPLIGFRFWQAAFMLALLRGFKDHPGPIIFLLRKMKASPLSINNGRRLLFIVILLGGTASLILIYQLWQPFDKKWKAVLSWNLKTRPDFILNAKHNGGKLELDEVLNTGANILTRDIVLYSTPFLIRIDAQTGKQLWYREDLCQALHPRGQIIPLFASHDCDGFSSSTPHQLEELNSNTGKTIRELSLSPPAWIDTRTDQEFTRDSGRFYFAQDKIYFLDMFGLTAFDPKDGKMLWNIFFTKAECSFISPGSGEPVVTQDKILIQGTHVLCAYSLIDGRFLYDVESINGARSVTPDGKRLITRHSYDYSDQNFTSTVEFDLATGKTIQTFLGDNSRIINHSNTYRAVEMMNYDLHIYRAGEAKPYLILPHSNRYPWQSSYTGIAVYGDYLFYHSMRDGGVYWHNLSTGHKSVLFKLNVGTYSAYYLNTERAGKYTTWDDIDFPPIFDENVLYIQDDSMGFGISRYELSQKR